MMTDPIADLLVRIQNGGRRGHDAIVVPASRFKGEVLRVLKAEGYIRGYHEEDVNGHRHFRVALRYVGVGQPIVTVMHRVSRPGLRRYVGRQELTPVRGGLGVSVLSTSRGVMTDRESRAAGIGGEVLFQVW